MATMSVDDAKKELAKMKDEYEQYKESTDPAEREYVAYLSGQIAEYERAFRELEAAK